MPEQGRATEKDWPKRPSDGQVQEAQKKTLIGPYLLRQRQSVSLHTWRRQGPESQAAGTPSHSAHTGAELPQAKKSLVSMRPGSFLSCPTLCDPVDCGLPGYSDRERGFSRQEYWSILAKYPSRALYFLLP